MEYRTFLNNMIYRRVMCSNCTHSVSILNIYNSALCVSLASLTCAVVDDKINSAHSSETNSDIDCTQKSYREFNASMKIDPHRLPNTIPGITQQELATMIATQYTKVEKEHSSHFNKELEHEIEQMRLALSDDNFAEYMKNLNARLDQEAAEVAKIASMSSVEYHLYQQKKRRQLIMKQWFGVLLIVGVIGCTIFSVLFLFVFFY